MISDARGGHVSPGVYTEERDVTYSVKSLGITSLGLAGETLKGPAFQKIPVKDWTEFTEYFGGTSPEKYVGTGLPKYELPYIAKEYLNESNNLNVVRVLGISGFEMSKAYGVQVDVDGTKIPVVVLRSKGDYNGQVSGTTCEGATQEKFREFVESVKILPYSGNTYDTNCVVAATPYVIGLEGNVTVLSDGTKEAVYNDSGVEREMGKFTVAVKTAGYVDNPFGSGVEYKYNVSLNPSDRDYIYKVFGIDPLVGSAPIFIESVYDFAYEKLIQKAESGASVVFSALAENGIESSGDSNSVEEAIVCGDTSYENYTDYKESYRCAMTPWIVSEVKDATTEVMNLKKLFRFYTISDGNAANYQVKISIQKIRPEEGLFDIVVRDFYDGDSAPVVLEKYSNVSLVEGTPNYIGLRIGTFDGEYEVKSKYITVEVSKEEGVEMCVPCGFLGYPVPEYGVGRLEMGYNTLLNPTIKPKRQYFGLNVTVLDEDVLNYKGRANYCWEPGTTPEKLTNGFHLDAILTENSGATIYVDSLSGFTFTTVDSVQVKGKEMNLPRILNENYMKSTIYGDINTRKFTVYPYGGFDGWDIYRESRTNTDDYKATKYAIVDGCPFELIDNVSVASLDPTLDLGLAGTAITSDYYAYLAGYNQFANPEDVDINLFATPGITLRDNVLLIEDALDIIEDPEDGRGGDALYVVDAARDGSADEIVDDVNNSEIDSSYAATYWPWVKYFDSNANKYIMLPPTKDVVRNMAETDNKSNPWFAPAGTKRGKMNVTKAEQKTKLLDEDALYENRINPIKTFAKDGVLVWGNKTLYSKETPLNRINVRRLMIRVKKLVVEASRNMIFENMDATLESQFRSLVEPILADVKSKRGIVDYRVMVENTPETRDQHILPARILIKPTQALEYISISFVVYPESVSFDEN